MVTLMGLQHYCSSSQFIDIPIVTYMCQPLTMQGPGSLKPNERGEKSTLCIIDDFIMSEWGNVKCFVQTRKLTMSTLIIKHVFDMRVSNGKS